MIWGYCQVGAGVITGFSVGVAVLSASVFTVSALLPDELIEPKWYAACLVAVAFPVGLLLCAMQVHGGNTAGTVGDEVIAHYTRLGDAEKLRAARFLVDNMRLHSFNDSPVLDKYYEGIERINKKYKYPACVEQYARLYGELGRPADVKEARDADALTAGELIENIDMAFADWREGLWAARTHGRGAAAVRMTLPPCVPAASLWIRPMFLAVAARHGRWSCAAAVSACCQTLPPATSCQAVSCIRERPTLSPCVRTNVTMSAMCLPSEREPAFRMPLPCQAGLGANL